MKHINSTVPLLLTLSHNNAHSIASTNAALCNGRTRSKLLCAAFSPPPRFIRSARGGAMSVSRCCFTPTNSSLKAPIRTFFPSTHLKYSLWINYNTAFRFCQGGFKIFIEKRLTICCRCAILYVTKCLIKRGFKQKCWGTGPYEARQPVSWQWTVHSKQ